MLVLFGSLTFEIYSEFVPHFASVQPLLFFSFFIHFFTFSLVCFDDFFSFKLPFTFSGWHRSGEGRRREGGIVDGGGGGGRRGGGGGRRRRRRMLDVNVIVEKDDSSSSPFKNYYSKLRDSRL